MNYQKIQLQKNYLPKHHLAKAPVARSRASVLESYRTGTPAVGSWLETLLPVKKSEAIAATRPAAAEPLRTLKFHLLRALLRFGGWTFGPWSFPRRLFFSNRSVNTM